MEKIKNRIKQSVLFQITNFHLYIAFFIISLIVILVSTLFSHQLLDILKNICYSIIAATFMACLIDYNNLNQSIKEKEEFRKRYFEEINHDLSVIVGHLLWLDENINNESINWEAKPQKFLIEIHANSLNKLPSKEITLNETIIRLEKLSDKFSSENLKNNEINKFKIKKIFKVIFLELQWLSWKLEKNNDDKIILEIKDYVYIKDTDAFLKNYYYCCGFILNNNFQEGIKFLIQSLKLIKHIGNYDENIIISIDEILFNIGELFNKPVQS